MRVVRGYVGRIVLAGLLVSSCGTPPHKEMDEAQGALDAARAAGAERYASTEYAAAEGALKQANTAVASRDYRLALNYALESREQAQNAARTAADTRARLRGDAERTMAEIKALIASTRARLKGPGSARMPARARRAAEQRLDQAEDDLQKAVTALANEDYAGASKLLQGIKERIQGVAGTLSRRSSAQSVRRRS